MYASHNAAVSYSNTTSMSTVCACQRVCARRCLPPCLLLCHQRSCLPPRHRHCWSAWHCTACGRKIPTFSINQSQQITSKRNPTVTDGLPWGYWPMTHRHPCRRVCSLAIHSMPLSMINAWSTEGHTCVGQSHHRPVENSAGDMSRHIRSGSICSGRALRW